MFDLIHNVIKYGHSLDLIELTISEDVEMLDDSDRGGLKW